MKYVLIDNYNEGISNIIPTNDSCPQDLPVEVREAVGKVFDEIDHFCYKHTAEFNYETVDNNAWDFLIFSIEEEDIFKYLADRDQNNLVTGV